MFLTYHKYQLQLIRQGKIERKRGLDCFHTSWKKNLIQSHKGWAEGLLNNLIKYVYFWSQFKLVIFQVVSLLVLYSSLPPSFIQTVPFLFFRVHYSCKSHWRFKTRSTIHHESLYWFRKRACHRQRFTQKNLVTSFFYSLHLPVIIQIYFSFLDSSWISLLVA